MAPLAGTYQFESQKNFSEYLQSLGISAENSKKSEDADQLVFGLVEADKIYSVFGGQPIVFILNKEVEYEFTPGLKSKATATLNGNIFTVKTKITADGSITDEKVFEPTDSGIVLKISTNKGVKAERQYKRV